jgi:signal peptidase II
MRERKLLRGGSTGVIARARHLLVFLLALGLVGCDHATKLAAETSLPSPMPLARGVLELRYVQNHDIAFDFFRRVGVPVSPAILALLGIVAIALVTIAARAPRHRVPLAFIVAGAIGNIVDRIVRGYVVDFIHVTGWPVFNVADVAVVIGVLLLIIRRHRVAGASSFE